MFFTASPLVTNAQYYVYNNSPIYVTTKNATNVTSSSATLNGLVNGSDIYNTYNAITWFEYGTSTYFGSSTARNNSNVGYTDYSANIYNLSPNTVYYFRAVAQNGQGVTYGNINSFVTGPTNVVNTTTYTNNQNYANSSVTTNEATSIGTRSVRLNAFVVNSPDYSATTWFEWGSTPTLGNKTPTMSLGTLNSARHINTISGLAPSTTYYFRAVIQNSSSRINGATLSFTTKAVAVQNNTESTTETTTTTENVTNTTTLEPLVSSIAANTLGAPSFLPGNIIGWLLVILLILILILLSKRLHGEFTGNTPTKDSHSGGHGH